MKRSCPKACVCKTLKVYLNLYGSYKQFLKPKRKLWNLFKAEIVDTRNLEVVEHDTSTPEYKILNIEISFNEIEEACKNLKAGKAPGHDGIVNEHIKYGGEVVFQYLQYQYLHILYNLMLKIAS